MTSSQNTTGAGGPPPGQRGESAAHALGSEAAQAVREQAENVYNQGSQSASVAARGTADAFDRTASNLSAEGQETLAQAASFMSSKLSALAVQLETQSLDDLMGQAQRLARDNPALFVGGGVAIGFALSRFFRASTPSPVQEPAGSGPAYGTEAAPPSEASSLDDGVLQQSSIPGTVAPGSNQGGYTDV